MLCSHQTYDVLSDDLGSNEFYLEEKTDHTVGVVYARYLVTTDKHVLAMFHCTNTILGIIFYGAIEI